MPTFPDPYALAERAAASIALASDVPSHDVAVILGTGLADAAAALGQRTSRHHLGALDGMPDSFASHQRSEMWSIDVGGRRILVFLGRLHLYQGYTAVEVAHPVRTAVATGCRTVVITNASGALRPDLAPGTWCSSPTTSTSPGVSPLTGVPTDDGRPSPFVDLVGAWAPELRRLARRVHDSLSEGVYAQVPGPHFETPAEIRMFRALGADLVGDVECARSHRRATAGGRATRPVLGHEPRRRFGPRWGLADLHHWSGRASGSRYRTDHPGGGPGPVIS